MIKSSIPLFRSKQKAEQWLSANCNTCKKGRHKKVNNPTEMTQPTCKRGADIYRHLSDDSFAVSYQTQRVCRCKKCPDYQEIVTVNAPLLSLFVEQ